MRGRTIKPSHRQIGRTNVAEDRRRDALAPGRRISRTGKKYTENRRNRSDLRKSKRL